MNGPILSEPSVLCLNFYVLILILIFGFLLIDFWILSKIELLMSSDVFIRGIYIYAKICVSVQLS